MHAQVRTQGCCKDDDWTGTGTFNAAYGSDMALDMCRIRRLGYSTYVQLGLSMCNSIMTHMAPILPHEWGHMQELGLYQKSYEKSYLAGFYPELSIRFAFLGG